MKIDSLKEATAALKTYLKEYSLEEIISNDKHNSRLSSIYRKYHALLIWHAYLNSNKSKINTLEKDNFFLYFNETISDMCQAILLWNHGLYKPSYLILRSSIENFLKCVGLQQGQAILKLSSTYDLFAVINGTKIVKDNVSVDKAFKYLRSKYTILCDYVHTTKTTNMSLTTSVGIFPVFIDDKADFSSKLIQGIIRNYVTILCFMFPNILRIMHHSNYDSIFSVLLKETRKFVSKL